MQYHSAGKPTQRSNIPGEIRITRRNLTKFENILTQWSVAQGGLNDEKTGSRKSCWIVPLMLSNFIR